jgi:site-specific recombinase XerD
MLTIRIKNNPTLGSLQCPFELSLLKKNTWYRYAFELERIVKFLGKDRRPEDVFKMDIKNLQAHLEERYGYTPQRSRHAISVLSSYYSWMMDMGFAPMNPCRYSRRRFGVEVLVEAD